MKHFYLLFFTIVFATSSFAQSHSKYLLTRGLEGLTVQTEALDISINGLNKFPKEIFKYPNLKILVLKDNQLKKIPEKIKYLKNLEVIDVSCNKLCELPKGIATLKKLKRLILSENYIKNGQVDLLKTKLPNCEIEFETPLPFVFDLK